MTTKSKTDSEFSRVSFGEHFTLVGALFQKNVFFAVVKDITLQKSIKLPLPTLRSSCSKFVSQVREKLRISPKEIQENQK